jgi:hypothetical protein
MIANNQLRPPNVGRRALGVAVCSLPALLLLASIGFGIARDRPSWFAGIGFMIAACIFAVFNRELGALGYPGYPPGGSPPSSYLGDSANSQGRTSTGKFHSIHGMRT